MEVLIILVTGLVCMFCFFIGFKCGKSEEVFSAKTKQNILHPIEALENNKIEKVEKEKKRIETIQDETVLGNIDTYNGFGNGQKDIPYFQEEGDEL